MLSTCNLDMNFEEFGSDFGVIFRTVLCLKLVIRETNSDFHIVLYVKSCFQAMFQSFDALEEELQNAKARARDKVQKDKSSVTGLQRINEDDSMYFYMFPAYLNTFLFLPI